MLNRRVGLRAAAWRGVWGLGALLVSAARLHAQQPAPAMPDSVRDYVNVALAAFRTHSVHRDTVDWRAVEDSVFAHAAGAQKPAETWQALSRALRSVDRHSFLLPPEHMRAPGTIGGPPAATPRPAAPVAAPVTAPVSPVVPADGLLEGRIGVVAVPGFLGRNRTSYVDSLQTRIAALDSAGACGWVVDLRGNTGGNMWPMLAGIGPLLGAEAVGSFTPGGPGTEWRYRDGRSWQGTTTMPSSPLGWGSVPPHRLARADAPVALLIGRRTTSSGEITLLAFLGRPNLRTFGDSTSGYASANTGIPLRDGAVLIVTASYPRDRMGRRYPLTIAPDELVPASAGEDAPLRRAVAWLRRQPACTARR